MSAGWPTSLSTSTGTGPAMPIRTHAAAAHNPATSRAVQRRGVVSAITPRGLPRRRRDASPLRGAPSHADAWGQWLFVFGGQIVLDLDGGGAAEAGGRHGLPIDPVNTVARGENARHISRRAVMGDDVAALVHFDNALEEVRVGSMAD